MIISRAAIEEIPSKVSLSKLRGGALFAAIGIVVNSSGCVVAPDDPSVAITQELSSQDVEVSGTPDQDQHLLAQVDFADSGSVKFYQLQPGVVVTLERGPVDPSMISRLEDDSLNPVERYEHLSGHKAPLALVRAVQSVIATDPQQPRRGNEHVVEQFAPSAATEGPVQKSWSIIDSASRQWFLDNYCAPTDRTNFWTWVTGDSWFRTTGTNYFKTGAYVNSGALTSYGKTLKFQVDVSDCGFRQCAPSHLWTYLKPGEYMGERVDCHNCTVKASVSEASGDIYDFCTNWHY